MDLLNETIALLSTPALACALAALLGLLVGSFLNVVILRLPPRLMHQWREQSREFLTQADTPPPEEVERAPAPPDLVFTGSHCPHCKHKLSAFENIPLLSFLVLRGRCRHCGTAISWQYPLVEFTSAVLSALVVWHFGPSWQAFAGLLFVWSLIALAGIDIRTQLLPDSITLPLLWLGLALSIPALFVKADVAILGAIVGYLSLWSVYWAFKILTGKEGMGYGDFKLLAALGAWMGPLSLLPIILMSSLIGAIVGTLVLAWRRQHRSTPIPFGPFIAAAGLTQFLCGEWILDGVLHLGDLIG